MRYRLKVSYRSDGRTYAPGDVLPDGVPASDLAYLRGKGFVEPVDTLPPMMGDIPVDIISCTDAGSGIGFPGTEAEGDEGISFPDLDGMEAEDIKTPEEIQKMRTKDEVYAYAQSIGLDLGDGYREESLKGLQERVISFQGGMDDI